MVRLLSHPDNLWKEMVRIEKKCYGKMAYRTISGEIVVCHPELARSVLAERGESVARTPPFWRSGLGPLPDEARRALNRWVVQRLYEQDPVESAEIALRRVLSADGDLHATCVQSLVDGLKVPMGCGEDPELERVVRTFFESVFLPTILGTITKRRNERLFENCSVAAGKCIANSWPELFPANLGFEDEPDFLARIGDLYLRRTAAFVASTSIALAWLLTVLFSQDQVSLRGPLPRSELDEVDPQWIALECLRLWPPSWRLRRNVTSDQVIGPISALAGDNLHVLLYAIQRHSDFWADPHSFKPARWQDTSPRELLAFGSGPGSCVGARFATEWLTAAVSMLRREHLKVSQIGRRPHVTTSFSPPISHVSRG
ncbi:cytochrome P450 [Amycolatopsis sp. NBC_01307]|uniref:cytochrome P450 n=1 Tax=Amycolatopsis sp. NBC_01307 TaxID=2903561 RepID=UPI002E10B336|nr:cytochrome P450 [Amycolatopsis sp. NBC_01307]